MSKAIYKFGNPNAFGETLRDTVFKEAVGCYNCFDVKDEFKPIAPTHWLGQQLIRILCLDNDYFDVTDDEDADIVEFMTDYPGITIVSNGTIHAAWYWDSDGTLLVMDESIRKAAINNDCKKDYCWRFFDLKLMKWG